MTFKQCRVVIESKLSIWGLETAPYTEETKRINDAINGLSPDLRKLLESRYRLAKTWECVAGELHREVNLIYEMRDKAIAVLAYRSGILTDTGPIR